MIVRALQGTRTNGIDMIYSIYHMYVIYVEIYFEEEWAHMILEAELSHDLPSVSWRPSTANSVIQSESRRPES